MKNILHIISLLFIIFPILICKEELLFAFQIHRHGARAPYKDVINNSDIYKETWLEKEELTNVGKRMLYLLGVKAKNRYIDKFGLLSREYSPQEILIRSTDVNRTIESVECFIQGLDPYPARNYGHEEARYVVPEIFVEKEAVGDFGLAENSGNGKKRYCKGVIRQDSARQEF